MSIIVGPTCWQETESVQVASLGGGINGGYLICRTGGGVAWIVAPASSEVSRDFSTRNDAVITATECTGPTDWFIPSCIQLSNPGYLCRTYWDSYSVTDYWSNTAYLVGGSYGWYVSFVNGDIGRFSQSTTLCSRAFRCVTY